MYPHFDLSRAYGNAVLQPHWKETEKVERIGFTDIEAKFRTDTGIDWIAYGWRRNDSFSRALIMKKCAGYDPQARRVFPLRAWRRKDVYDYLELRGIPLPEKIGREEQSGLDFHPASIAMLKRRPEDWAKWKRDFPFSEVQLVGKDRDSQASEPAKTAGEDLQASSNTAPRRKAIHAQARGKME